MKNYEKTQIIEIAKEIKSGKIVALPTETVFGLAVLADDTEAIDKLDALKERKKDKKYALMLGSTIDVSNYAQIDKLAKKIIEKHLPGELTLVLPKNQNYKNEYYKHSETIGIRVPNDDFLQKLIKITGPIIVTSANTSGEKPYLNSVEIKKYMPNVNVLVAGKAGNHPPTAVIELRNGETIVHRKGALEI